MIANSEG